MNNIEKFVNGLILLAALLSYVFAGVCRFETDPVNYAGSTYWLLTAIFLILVYIGSKASKR